MPSWTPSSGKPDTKEDDDVLQHIPYFESKEAEFNREGDPEAAAQCREAAEEYRAEAKRRGLIPADE
ncbi:hypothetical protein [Nocardia mangyaensis]|uniref:hypothetical protein n=1 Tax=Nocardia mangyaensis TaxID=2213200 RepID=UPI0012EBE290|nr:hypothetical protein [Nocardia mangyaensis]